MFHSKPVKSSYLRFKDWGKLEFLKEPFYKVRSFLRWPFRKMWRIRLVWDWYWNVLRHDFDWDHSYIWRVLEYKLKRVLIALEEGHLYQDEQRIKGLKECIKILDRLINKDFESYFEPAYDPHDKKWGKMKTWTTPNKDATGKVTTHTWHSGRPKAKTSKQKEQERKEFLAAGKKEDDLRNADRKRLYELMYEHEMYWWD